MAKTKAPSRSQRWFSAVDQGRKALEQLESLGDEVNEDIQEAMQNVIDTLQEHLDRAGDKIRAATESAQEAVEDLKALQEEYQEWYDNMPQQLQDGPTGEKLYEITNMDFDWEADIELEVPQIETPEVELDLSSLESILDEAESAELPMGFGRD